MADKGILFHEIELQNFFLILLYTTMSFGRLRLRETIFFPLGAWCVCVLFSLHFRRNFLNVTQFLTWSYQ